MEANYIDKQKLLQYLKQESDLVLKQYENSKNIKDLPEIISTVLLCRGTIFKELIHKIELESKFDFDVESGR